MIKPLDFQKEDFISPDNVRVLNALKEEALSGSALIDNLILLQFCDLSSVQSVMQEKYKLSFGWLRVDPTPPEFREIADKHGVFIERSRFIIVYVPLGVELDDAMLHVDIPQYEIRFRFIPDCNYRIIKTGVPANLLSPKVADFRPLLVFRRLIIDCIESAGTDIHFESRYVNKQPDHVIRYRVKRELVDSRFKIDKEMMQEIIQAVVGQLSPASAGDIDSAAGITTEVRDLFRDETTDLRITGMRIDAGFYMVIAIQTTTTTTKKIDELGFPKADVQLIRQIAQKRTGLTLVTGEMRSGKNTTIFAMLNEIINEPIRIIEYSNPVENHMSFPQFNYKGDVELLSHLMRMAKKQDLDIAVLNEIPNAEVAFAVRDLVNSAIGVITTTHINRLWHLPNKLREFFGDDYKTIISQLNAVINHKMFRRWKAPNMQKRTLVKEHGPFELFCYKNGVRQYFVAEDMSQVQLELQPLTEILVITDEMKTSMLNYDELWRAEQMLQSQLLQARGTLENKVAAYINEGIMSLDEMRRLY